MNSLRFSWPARLPRLLGFSKKCLACTSVEFTDAEFHSLDRVLSLLAFHPIRCVNCWRRYYGFSKTNKATTQRPYFPVALQLAVKEKYERYPISIR
jgi:hypothetical protein